MEQLKWQYFHICGKDKLPSKRPCHHTPYSTNAAAFAGENTNVLVACFSFSSKIKIYSLVVSLPAVTRPVPFRSSHASILFVSPLVLLSSWILCASRFAYLFRYGSVININREHWLLDLWVKCVWPNWSAPVKLIIVIHLLNLLDVYFQKSWHFGSLL